MRLVITFCILVLSLGGYCQQSIIAKDLSVLENLRTPLDTLVNPKFLYEIRFRSQDSSFYNAMAITGKKWYKNTFTQASLGHTIDSALYSADTLTIVSGGIPLDFPSINAGGWATLTITVASAAKGDAVSLGVPDEAFTEGLIFTARASAAGVVSVYVFNLTGGPVNPAPGTFKIRIIQ